VIDPLRWAVVGDGTCHAGRHIIRNFLAFGGTDDVGIDDVGAEAVAGPAPAWRVNWTCMQGR
jgi:hypothetical protein